LPSRFETVELKLTEPVDIKIIVAHMSASVGQEKAQTFVAACLTELQLPAVGILDASSADRLLTRMGTEPGLVGIAARVTKQMVRLKRAPSLPTS
jgi:hypothetical protein